MLLSLVPSIIKASKYCQIPASNLWDSLADWEHPEEGGSLGMALCLTFMTKSWDSVGQGLHREQAEDAPLHTLVNHSTQVAFQQSPSSRASMGRL